MAVLCGVISCAPDHSKTMIVTKTLVAAATTTVATGIISAAAQYSDPQDSIEKHYDDALEGGLV